MDKTVQNIHGSRINTLAAAIILLVTFGLYLGSLQNGFIYDDMHQVVDNRWIRSARNIPEIFTSSVWDFRHGATSSYYRPLLHVVYMLTYLFSGRAPWGYHMVNILLHAGVSVLVFLLVRELLEHFGHRRQNAVFPALASSLLYATHPVHTEAVNWIAGMHDVACTLCFLLSLHFHLRFRAGRKNEYPVSVAFFFLAALFKETALILPAVLIACDLSLKAAPGGRPLRFRVYVPYLLAACVYLGLRFYALGGLSLAQPRITMSVPGYLINMPPLFMQYLAKLLMPVNLNFYHVFHPVSSILDPKGMLSLVIAAVYASIMVVSFRRNRLLFFGLVLIALPLIPALYAFCERYLYLPAVGYVLLIAQVLTLLRERRPALANGALAASLVLAAVYASATFVRSTAWRNEQTLYTDTLKKSPSAVEIRYNLAIVHEEQGRLREAELEYLKTIKRDPAFARAHNNLGVLYARQGRFNDAAGHLRTALTLRPDNAGAHNNLGMVCAERGMFQDAVIEFSAALALNPDYRDALFNLGSAYMALGLQRKAELAFQSLVERDPSDNEARTILARLRERSEDANSRP